MPNLETDLDAVFLALGDRTRRGVIERLSRGPAGVSELSEPFEMALPSFTQHLSVLEDRGLIRSTKSGRVRVCEIVPRPLQQAERWMVSRRSTWERRIEQLDDYLNRLKRS